MQTKTLFILGLTTHKLLLLANSNNSDSGNKGKLMKTDGRLTAEIVETSADKVRVAVGYVDRKEPIYLEWMTVDAFEGMFA